MVKDDILCNKYCYCKPGFCCYYQNIILVDYFIQAVDIHKEKVARREIGSLANSKNITRAQKVVAPSQKERQQKHMRSRIDFNSLDHIGHGVRTGSTSNLPDRFSTSSAEVNL